MTDFEEMFTRYFSRVNQLRLIDGKLYSISGYDSDQVYDPGTGEYIETMIPNYEPVTELRLGTEKDYVTIWKEGDEIPIEENMALLTE